MRGKELFRAPRMVLALAAWVLLVPSAALAQVGAASLFTADARAPAGVPVGGTAAGAAINEPARVGRVDHARLGALHESVASGRPEKLRLNLPHGVEYRATIERSVSTASGYTLSGPLEGVPFGRAVLVVNGGTVVGRVYTPQGNWAIRTAGAMQTVERMERQPWRCGADVPRGAAKALDGPAPLLDPYPTRHVHGAIELAPRGYDTEGRPDSQPQRPAGSTRKSAAADDGDVVDVLVVYPSFIREIEGGYAPMLALIDLDIATANEAYAASGVELRVDLAAAVEVEYDWFLEMHGAGATDVSDLWGPALDHLSESDDGYLDEVHALRDRHAADLVLLHLGGYVSEEFLQTPIGGIAGVIFEVTVGELEKFGFTVASSGDGTVVAHELGHVMGLHHDRYDSTWNEPFPYSHGFSYKYVEDVLGDVSGGEDYWLGTVMSVYGGVPFPGYVLAFSNPELGHPENPDLKLGVPGDEPSFEADGPADAARHLNELRDVIVNVRPRAGADKCRYTLSGDEGELPPEGGTYRIQVETGADCDWTASAGEWVESISPVEGTGSGEIEFRVGRNEHWRRPVEVLAGGRLHRRHQAGSRTITPACERSGQMVGELVTGHPDYGTAGHLSTACDYFNFDEDYLANIRTFRPPANINTSHDGFNGSGKWGFIRSDEEALRPGDFDGMTGLVDLKIHSMEHLPPGLISGLTGLRVLELGQRLLLERDERTLETIAPGSLRGLSGLRRMELRGHGLRRFEAGMFDGLSALLSLIAWSTGDKPLALEPGAFKGLSSLLRLFVTSSGMRRIEPGVFDGLDKLRLLFLQKNAIDALPAGAFDGLPELRYLDLHGNRITALPTGLFDGLSTLEELHLSGNRISRIDSDTFRGLPNLWGLRLSENRLTSLPPSAFDELAALEFLNLRNNRLTELDPGVFKNLSRLRTLSLVGNRLRLEPGVFDGLSRLYRLFLTDTGMQEIPDGLFAGLGSLQWLSLAENQLGVVQKGAFDGLDLLFELNLWRSGVTSLEPGLFDARSPRRMTLAESRLRTLGPGALRGLDLQDFDLRGNPGAPFTFAPTPVALPVAEAAAGRAAEVAVEILSAAPFEVTATLGASGGSVSRRNVRIAPGEVRSDAFTVTPEGDGPVTVRVAGQPRAVWNPRSRCSPRRVIGLTGRDACYRGVRVAAGPPLVLYGIEDRSLTLGQGSESIELAGVFSYFLGSAEYAAQSSDDATAAVAVEDGVLTVTPGRAGTAEVTVTATAPDGETMVRRFSVTVRMPSVPLFLSDANRQREGFVRLLNLSERAGTVLITAVDDSGARRGPVSLRLRANGAAHFNSGDLEEGNAAKGLPEGVGVGQGNWRLEFETDLEIEALAYVRTADGFVTAMHDAAPVEGNVRRIATFNPASNDRQASRLRVLNSGREAASVTVRGVDDLGASPGGPVRFTVPAGGAREFDAVQLESGDMALEGALGDGEGKWRLLVESEAPIVAMSLLESFLTGHLTNLSSVPPPVGDDGVHRLPLFPAASAGRQGFARVVNHSNRPGTVRIEAYDDAGERYGPLELSIGAGEAAHFNSDDLEFGNAGKGLSGSTGAGEGDWRLEMISDLDIEVLGYIRTDDGFLTSMHDAVAVEDGRRLVAIFNPGSNTNQMSRLRLVNPLAEAVRATIHGTDDAGGSPEGAAWVTVPARGTLTLSAAELEAGVPSETFEGSWDRHPLRDGSGKWRLSVATEPGLMVQSLLESPTGHLTNLSSDGQ